MIILFWMEIMLWMFCMCVRIRVCLVLEFVWLVIWIVLWSVVILMWDEVIKCLWVRVYCRSVVSEVLFMVGCVVVFVGRVVIISLFLMVLIYGSLLVCFFMSLCCLVFLMVLVSVVIWFLMVILMRWVLKLLWVNR